MIAWSLLLLLSLWVAPPAVQAAALSWVGTGADNNFNTPANWSPNPGAAPGTGDTCTINSTSSRQPSILANATCGSLTLGTGGTVMTLTFTAGRNLAITGNVTIGANGRIGPSGTPTGTFTIGGDWSDDLATTNFIGPNLNLTYSFNGTAKTISTNESFYDVSIDGSITLSSSITIAGSLTISNTKSLTQGANTITLNAPNFTINGTYNHTCTATVVVNAATLTLAVGSRYPNVIINSGGNLNVNNGSYIDCDLTLNAGGTWTITSLVYIGGDIVHNGGTIICGGGNPTMTGVGKRIRGTVGTAWFHHVTIGDGAGDSVTAEVNLQFAQDVTVVAGATFSVNPNLNVEIGRNLSNSGTVNLSGTTTVTMTAGGDITVASGGLLSAQGTNSSNRVSFTRSGASYYSLVINGGIDFNFVNIFYTRSATSVVGFAINSPGGATVNFNYVAFNFTEDGNKAAMFHWNANRTITATGVTFDSATYTPSQPDVNVKAVVGTINLTSYGGNYAGEDKDDDAGGNANWILCSGVVTTTADTGPGSLRECVTNANATAGANTITFNIAGCPGGICTITPATVLPALSDATGGTTVDGYTQIGAVANTVASPGASDAVLNIQLSGGGASFAGLTLSSANNIVKGLVINGFSGVGAGYGINITGASATGNTVSGNYLGTNAAGTAGAGNYTGVDINGGAQSNTVGGTTPAARNLISGNTSDGIDISNATTSANIVKGNYIGTQKDGTSALANTFDGVGLYAPSNIIGGATAADRNIISGNGAEGMSVAGTSNTIKGNFIGVDVNGNARPNGDNGIQINGGGTSSIVGGTSAGEGNIIANNSFMGLWLRSTGNQILGNTIYNNAQEGIKSIATNQTLAMNLIRNNGGVTYNGIALNAGATNNKIYHNTIHANGASGVYINDTGAIIRNNIITGNTAYGINRVAASMTESYNDVTDAATTPANASGRSNVALDATDLNTNPLYVNAGAGNFTLTECTSPAINAGIDLAADQPDMNGGTAGLWNNNAPEMGAFETTTACTPPLGLVKQVWQVGGTAPLAVTNGSPALTNVPVGSTLVFLIFVRNIGGAITDARFSDLLDITAAGFTYTAGSLVRTSAATPPADTATDLAIFNATAPGTGTALTDAADGDVASRINISGTQDRITVGNTTGLTPAQVNGTLAIGANTTFAIRFRVTKN